MYYNVRIENKKIKKPEYFGSVWSMQGFINSREAMYGQNCCIVLNVQPLIWTNVSLT